MVFSMQEFFFCDAAHFWLKFAKKNQKIAIAFKNLNTIPWQYEKDSATTAFDFFNFIYSNVNV